MPCRRWQGIVTGIVTSTIVYVSRGTRTRLWLGCHTRCGERATVILSGMGNRPYQSGKGYDADKVCGDYGGKTAAGGPCQQPAGWKSEEVDDGRCFQHDRGADDFKRSTKARILELLPAVGSWKQVCDQVGLHARTLFEWKRADGAFKDEVDTIIDARDRDRAAQVEDHVFNRILTDRASPAEIIFYLKNRDRDRWRDNYESPADRMGRKESAQMANVDDPKHRLTEKLRTMARRAAESTKAATERGQADAQSADDVVKKIQKVQDERAGGDDDEGDGAEA